MNDLSVLVAQGAKDNPGQEIYAIVHKGKKLWVKEARETGSNILHKLAYTLTNNPLLSPVAQKSKIESVQYESSKINRLRTLEIPVPKIVDVTDTYFVLEDCGPIIHDLLHHNRLEDPEAVFRMVIMALADLHDKNEFHGATQLKNLTYADDQVCFIDFEESFDEGTDIRELQFRDLFLFLFSLSKEKAKMDYAALIEQYIALTGDKGVIEKFRKLISQVSFLMKVIEKKYIWNMLDTDTKSVYALLQDIQEYINTQSHTKK